MARNHERKRMSASRSTANNDGRILRMWPSDNFCESASRLPSTGEVDDFKLCRELKALFNQAQISVFIMLIIFHSLHLIVSACHVIICKCRHLHMPLLSAYAVIIGMSRNHQHMTWSNKLCWCSSWILLLTLIALGHLLKWRHDIKSWRWHGVPESWFINMMSCNFRHQYTLYNIQCYTFSSNVWLHINSNALHAWLIWRGVQLHPRDLKCGPRWRNLLRVKYC